MEIRDANGPYDVGVRDTTINLYTTSGLGRFDTSDVGSFNGSVTSVVVLAGHSSVEFIYRDNMAGTPTLTAASTGLTSGTQTETVNAPNKPVKVAFTTGSFTSNTGAALPMITVEIQDASNIAFPVLSNTTVNLNSTSGLGRFDTSNGGAFNGSITSVIVIAGQSSVSFYYKDNAAGTPTLTASSTGLTKGTQVETVNAAPKASKVAFIGGPTTFNRNVAGGSITIQIQDAGAFRSTYPPIPW